MTTQINVIVDNGGLSAKAKQQTNANRWAKLEKDGKELVYRRASDERVDALARVGLDPNSNPLYGTSPQLQVRKDEPAAFRLPNGIEYGWFRMWTTSVQKRPNSFSSGIGFPVSYSGYAPRLQIQTANGYTYTDPDYEKALLVYPPTYPYTGYLHGEFYTAYAQYLLPVSKTTVILVLCNKQYNVFNFLRPSRQTPTTVVQEYETKEFARAFLITPDTVKPLTVPSSLRSYGLGYNEPQYVTFQVPGNTQGSFITLVKPQPIDATRQDAWLQKRRQIEIAMTQYGTMFFSKAVRTTTPFRIRQFFSGGQANNQGDLLYGLSAAGPAAYEFLAQEQAFKNLFDAAYDAGNLSSLNELEVIRTYDWLEPYIRPSLKVNKIYGFDRNWSDTTKLSLDLYSINKPAHGWYATSFDGGLADTDITYPPRNLVKSRWLEQPLSVLTLNVVSQAKAPSIFFFTPGKTPAFCQQQLLALGFTTTDLTP